jgi:hypothetical protein
MMHMSTVSENEREPLAQEMRRLYVLLLCQYAILLTPKTMQVTSVVDFFTSFDIQSESRTWVGIFSSPFASSD